MKKIRIAKLAATAALAAAVAFSSTVFPAAGSLKTSAAGAGGTYSRYFNDVYSGLTDTSPVFEAITFSKLHYLLQQDGNYVILWGGKTNQTLQSKIAAVNSVAKQYGVEKIYNFDPRLDGGKNGDVANIEGTAGNTINYAKQLYAQVFQTLYPAGNADFTGSVTYKDTDGTQKTVKAIPEPTLLVYNKSHKEGEAASPVVASASDLSEANVKAALDKISTNGKANAATYSDSDFITDSYNHQAAINGDYTKAENTPKPIFDGSGLVFDSVTYDEFIQLLKSKGSYVLFIGGSWCPNTRAAVKWVNQEAKKYNVGTVYNLDPHLDDNYHSDNDPLNIRVSNVADTVTIGNGAAINDASDKNNTGTGSVPNAVADLYVDLVNEYWPNLLTENGPTRVIQYEKDGKTVTSKRLQAPFVLGYDSENKDSAGKAAPVLRENILPAAGGKYPNGVKELMFHWYDTQPGSDNYKTEIGALDALYEAFGAHQLVLKVSPAKAKKDSYTADSYKAFDAALTAVLNVSADYSKTAADIQKAADALDAAYQGLKPVQAGDEDSGGKTADGEGSDSGTNPHTGDAGRSIPAAAALLAAAGLGVWAVRRGAKRTK